jgi:hypothetical protein
MQSITDTFTTAQDQVLEVIERIQEPAVDAVRAIVETVEGVLPEDRPTVPYPNVVPDAKAVVELSFAFAQKVLDNQHDFAKAMLDAVTPLLPVAPVSAPKSAKPASTKKAA